MFLEVKNSSLKLKTPKLTLKSPKKNLVLPNFHKNPQFYFKLILYASKRWFYFT